MSLGSGLKSQTSRTSRRARDSASTVTVLVLETCRLMGADTELWEPSHNSDRDSAYDGSRE